MLSTICIIQYLWTILTCCYQIVITVDNSNRSNQPPCYYSLECCNPCPRVLKSMRIWQVSITFCFSNTIQGFHCLSLLINIIMFSLNSQPLYGMLIIRHRKGEICEDASSNYCLAVRSESGGTLALPHLSTTFFVRIGQRIAETTRHRAICGIAVGRYPA